MLEKQVTFMVKKNVNYNILATSTNTHPTFFFPKKQIIKDWNQDFFH